MSAIAGYVARGEAIEPARACDDMLRALALYGPDARDSRTIGNAAFGRNLFKSLPEDNFDAQPLEGGGGRFLMTADIRLDNRGELIGALNLDPSVAATMSDSAFVIRAWERWRHECLDRLLGDYALAVWDVRDRSLTLARSPLALKPLFYHSNPRFLAFASMPAGLHALASIPKEINFGHAAAVAAEHNFMESSTIFAGVKMVRHGHLVRLKGDREETIATWTLERHSQPFKSSRDNVEALRSEFERAVAVRLRRYRGQVGAQLSAGRDSSAVATTAARLLAESGEELAAFTGAPRLGFVPPTMPNRLADESELAGRTSSAHPNMRHFVCRPGPVSLRPALERMNAMHYGPLLNPSNLPWWTLVNDEASARDVSILLLGSFGNFTISAGGERHLPDVLIEKGFMAWLGMASGIARMSPGKWRSIARYSLGPRLPRSAFAMAMRASGRSWTTAADVPMLRSPYREGAEQLLTEMSGDPRPHKSFFDYRREMLGKHENSELITLGGWGIEPRDPTSDRRLIETCFSLPVEQLVSASSARPAFDAAFSDRIPGEVLDSKQRGYQSADWFELFRKEDVEQCFDRYGRNRTVRELLDLKHIRKVIDAWPTGGWEKRQTIFAYRNKLLGTLALASYVEMHFPD